MNRRHFSLLPLLLALVPFAAAWREEAPPAYAKTLGDPVPGLTDAEDDLFIRGRRLFRWQLWPPSRGAEGINSTECTECHLDPVVGGANADPKLLVAVVPDPEDPSGFKVFPKIALGSGRRGPRREPPAGSELRRIPALFGLGLLEAVPEEAILSRADPEDKDGDGISGRVITVEGGIGRFGSKAAVSSVERFVIQAFKGELGMRVEPIDQPDFSRLGTSQVRAVSYFIRNLGAPKPDAPSSITKTGFEQFKKIGCASCHIPSLETSDKAPLPLRGKRVEAFTDLLLHDVGPGPAPLEKSARPSLREFRTTPLWGIGKVGGPYWHDASVPTLEEAIRKHEGEASKARDAYLKLSEAERKAVLAFLGSL